MYVNMAVPNRSRLGIYITDVQSASHVAEDLPLKVTAEAGVVFLMDTQRSIVDRVRGPGSFLFGMVERRFLSAHFQRGL